MLYMIKIFCGHGEFSVIEGSQIQVLCMLYVRAKRDLILAIISGDLSSLLFPSLFVFRWQDSSLFIVHIYFVFGLLSFSCFENLETFLGFVLLF